MAQKYQNKYRIPSARMQNWDYEWDAAYFVTICTHNKEHYFGQIVEKQFIASEIGEIAQQYWLEIPQQFPFVTLDNFVVMPNHIHGIVIINNHRRDAIHRVSRVSSHTPIKKPGGITGNNNPMLHQNLSRIIRWYKGRVTFESRKIHADFAWQSRFHDHIIRHDNSYKIISEYIVKNPVNWQNDKFYK